MLCVANYRAMSGRVAGAAVAVPGGSGVGGLGGGLTVGRCERACSPAHLSSHKAAGKSYDVMNNRKAILPLLARDGARLASNKCFAL